MGALTQNERDGLEDVFLSIHSREAREKKYDKLKYLSNLIMSHKSTINFSKLFKEAKLGIKEAKFSNIFHHYSKKKKNLSK